MTNLDETLLSNVERVMAGEPEPVKYETPGAEARAAEERAIRTAPKPEAPKYEQPAKLSPVQVIARDITKLTWREAEAMGRAIQEKAKGGGEGSLLTQAIQDWAWAWQTFKEEEQPK